MSFQVFSTLQVAPSAVSSAFNLTNTPLLADYSKTYPDALFIGSILATTLTVTSVTSGYIQPYQTLYGNGGLVANTVILAQLTLDANGNAGGVGTYTVSQTQTAASQLMNTSQNIVLTVGNYAILKQDYYNALSNILYLDGSGLTAARNLTVGADTNANAAYLLSLFGLNNENDGTYESPTALLGVDQVAILQFNLVSTDAAFTISLENTSGTANAVKIYSDATAIGAASNTGVIAVASATAQHGLVIVSVKAEATTASAGAGNEIIGFHILKQALV